MNNIYLSSPESRPGEVCASFAGTRQATGSGGVFTCEAELKTHLKLVDHTPIALKQASKRL